MRHEDSDRPTIVCLCGSTRFKDSFIEANRRESLAGKVVLTVGWFSHAEPDVFRMTEEQKTAADRLHMEKIRMADEVLIINVDGYVGESTRKELAYAMELGKRVRFLEGEDLP